MPLASAFSASRPRCRQPSRKSQIGRSRSPISPVPQPRSTACAKFVLPVRGNRLGQKLRHAIVELFDQRLVEFLRHTGRTASRRRRRAALPKPAPADQLELQRRAGTVVRIEFLRHAPGLGRLRRARRPPRASRPAEPAQRPVRRELQRAEHQFGGGGMVAGAEQHLGIVGRRSASRSPEEMRQRFHVGFHRRSAAAISGVSSLIQRLPPRGKPLSSPSCARATCFTPRPEGLYCPPGDFYIDPVRPVDRALITHGHSDHARPGHGSVLATRQTLDIMALRYGEGFAGTTQAVEYGESDRHQRRARRRSTRPAMCWARRRSRSSMAALRIVASGDYKRAADPTCAPFEPVKCDVFITEATFGLPVFRHPDPARRDRAAAEIGRAVSRTRASGRRLCARQGAARHRGCCATPATTGRSTSMARWPAQRLLPERRASISATWGRRQSRRRARRISPARSWSARRRPSQDRWARRFPDPVSCFASGWMRIRQRAKQGGVELPLIISDHSDWDELTDTIVETGASRSLGHAWRARRRWCAGASSTASPRSRCTSSATNEDEDRRPVQVDRTSARAHEPLRRAARPPGADAGAQRQAEAAGRLFPHASRTPIAGWRWRRSPATSRSPP